jgi:hypothetical protein
MREKQVLAPQHQSHRPGREAWLPSAELLVRFELAGLALAAQRLLLQQQIDDAGD